MSAPSALPYGEVIKDYRKRSGISQDHIATLTNEDVTCILELEAQNSPPSNPAFYPRLLQGTGCINLFVQSVLQAAEVGSSTEELEKLIAPVIESLKAKPEVAEVLWRVITTPGEIQDPHLQLPNVAAGNYGKIPSKTVKSSEHPSGHTPDPQREGDPSTGQGKNVSKPGFEPLRGREIRRKSASPEHPGKTQGVVYDRGRERYARKHLQATAETLAKLQVAAVKNPNDPLSPAAVRALGEFAEEAVKIRGISASDAAREFNVPTDFLLRWAKKEGIITILSVGIGPGSPTFLDREEARGAADIFHEAKRQGIQPKKLLQTMTST
jgi:hypothetical protein